MATSASPSSSPPTSAPPSCRGLHLICELYGASHLTDVDHLTRVLEEAAERCGATILETRLHPFEEHGGITGVVLLAESHITIHTWPEHAYVAVDLFMCGRCDPKDGVPVLQEGFEPDTIQHSTYERGQAAANS